MGKFHDMTSSIGMGDDGVSPAYPEAFISDITSAYDEDMSIPGAKIGVLEQDLAAAHAEIAALKAHNYDLLMQVPTAPVEGVEEEPEPSGDDEEDQGTDSLFGDNEKDKE